VYGGVGVATDGTWIDQMTEDAAKLAETTQTNFFKTAAQHGLVRADTPREGVTANWRDEIGRATDLVAARARFFDLVILGRSDRVIDQPSTDVIEQTLLSAGRPVLLAPATAPAALGKTIAVGWDGSVQSVRGLAAAMPLLRKATKAIVMTIGNKPDADTAAANDYLRWHGIASEVQNVSAVSGVGPGELLLSAARDAGADLLAMGAFGKGPWREMLFGGATRTIVGSSLLPVLMTH